jgi:voltage-gated potassium channel
MTLKRRLAQVLILFSVIMLVGTSGYVLIEDWPLVDAFYMAIITVTTVGFGEIHPLTPAGRLFTSALIILGVAGITYTFSVLTKFLIEGQVSDTLEEFRMDRKIEELEGHHIVCGFGRVGSRVCADLQREGLDVVVIDNDLGAVERARERGLLALQGNAGEDRVLEEAGIHRARSVVSVVASDADNLFVVVTARVLNPDLYIVCRAEGDDNFDKLLGAGADRVVSPYSIGGHLIAQTVVRPDVVDFLDVVMYDDSLKLQLEDLEIDAGSSLVGQTLDEARIRETIGANVLGIKRADEIIVSPETSARLEVGDILVTLGTREQLARLSARVMNRE